MVKIKKFKTPELNDEDWLFQKYVNEELSTKDIGEMLGCNPETVRNALIKFETPRRHYLTEAQRKKVGDAERGEKGHFFGKRLSDEHKKKISDGHTQFWTNNPDARKEKSNERKQFFMDNPDKCLSGENNPNWKGGITKWRIQLWHSETYKNWRYSVFKRDKHVCQMCGARGEEAHHIKPVRDHKNDLSILDINNGITLCKDCHRSVNYNESDFEHIFNTIIEFGGIR